MRNATNDRWQADNKRVNGNVNSHVKSSGELSSVKVGRWVRKGGVGKVSLSLNIKKDNSLALYLIMPGGR